MTETILLHERLKNCRLLLASQSPRRRELLAGCGLPFVLAPKYDCAERYPADLPSGEVAGYLSQLKSRAYPEPLAEGDILLTADTVVIVENRVLGKPHSRAEAVQMLQALSGRSHTVVTGVTLRDAGRIRTFSVATQVWFRALTAAEIDHYVTAYKPFDKAGSYGVQEWIGYVGIERIDGSFYNVMGLPVQKVYTELEKFLDR